MIGSSGTLACATGAGQAARLILLAFAIYLACCCWLCSSALRYCCSCFLVSAPISRSTSAIAPLKRLTYWSFLLGLAVAFGVEIIYVRDFLDHSDWERMNTVFKFYYQVWTLLSLGGVLALSQIFGRILPWRKPMTSSLWIARNKTTYAGTSNRGVRITWRPRRLGWRCARRYAYRVDVSAGGAALWVTVFLVEGTQARVNDPAIWAAVQPPPGGVQPQGLSLDGMAYMRGWYPGDYAAINWLNDHVAGAPVIVGGEQWAVRMV